MPKRISPAERTPVHVTMVTLDTHLAAAAARAEAKLKREIPGLRMSFHAAAHWGSDPQALERCHADIASADLVFVSMIFTEDQIEAVRPALEARRDSCDAMACVMSAPAISELTRLGSLDMRKPASSTMEWLKKLRGKSGKGDAGKPGMSAGARQMAMLRRLPQVLKFIPGTAQDLRAYLLAMNYWLLGSEANIQNLIRVLVNRYAGAERADLRKCVKPRDPVAYPDVGVYHPCLPDRISENPADLPGAGAERGRVGLLLMRSYLLAENTAHYDAVIEQLEQRGLSVVPAFSSSLDARPAIDACFKDKRGNATVDAVVSLTGFSLVGGPAYNDCDAAVGTLEGLDVPYLSAQALEFQTIEAWEANHQGLLPLETVLMVAIPELDGATASMVYGGRGADAEANGAAAANGHRHNGAARKRGAASSNGRSAKGNGTAAARNGNGAAASQNGAAVAENMVAHQERISALADRVEQLVNLRRRERAERRLGVVLFNFPPNAGAVGSAAHLAVFESLFNVLTRLQREGYTVTVPESVDALRESLLHGNAERFGTDANVAITIDLDDYVRKEPHLEEIEAVWGPAPGRQLSDGRRLFVLGARFGNVFVGLQPGFGIEGDPMRLMFEGTHAPTHAFTAFYHFLKHEFRADALLHFGTHGALEFMPGKQVGMSGSCWPERLIGAVPNYYLYAANNPSEGTIAKRRANATVLTHLTPPLAEAGLYRELADLRDLLDSYRATGPEQDGRPELKAMIVEQAAALELQDAGAWEDEDSALAALSAALAEVEASLIPSGLHVIGRPLSEAARRDMLKASASADGTELSDAELEALLSGPQQVTHAEADPHLTRLRRMAAELAKLDELDAIVHALDGRYVAPVAGGDLVSNPDILPTGRNIHGFDPTRLPSAVACATGRRLAEKLLATQAAESGSLPEMIAMILWGTDNLKTEGVSLAQALWLMGAKPRLDSYGRLAGADLVSLEELGRPRVDVLVTLSGIFRDLLPDQIKLLAEAALKAASADEPLSDNPIRKHALAFQQAHGVSLEAAAMRVFSNDNGAYGANVNLLVDSGLFQDDDELGHMFARRKCFAYGVDNRTHENQALMTSLFGDVDLTYQNLDSIELGVTTVDHYFDSLGGVSKAVELARGEAVPTYIGDQTQGRDTVRTLADQVALETRTRLLNPRWYEELLNHGHEGVHQLQVHVTNTMGWSATTGQVAPWVYRQLSRTFVLDEAMRERLATLNPAASLKLANRLLEAHERNYWSADPEDLEALRRAEESLEDRLEGIDMTEEVAT